MVLLAAVLLVTFVLRVAICVVVVLIHETVREKAAMARTACAWILAGSAILVLAPIRDFASLQGAPDLQPSVWQVADAAITMASSCFLLGGAIVLFLEMRRRRGPSCSGES